MTRARLPLLIVVMVLPASTSANEPLTLSQRIEAQETIERVYASYRIGADRPFEESVPRSVIENKVRTYLLQTVALERFWGRVLNASDLDGELQRMAGATLYPDRLHEISAALNHDPLLLRECLARPVLTNRLARAAFAAEHPARLVSTRDGGRNVVETTWDEWWNEVRSGLDDGAVSVPVSNAPPPSALLRLGDVACIGDDTWDNGSLAAGGDAPAPTYYHVAVWTGAEMITWGGFGTTDGHRYDPVLDAWSPIAPYVTAADFDDGFAFWTGSVMLVWHGEEAEGGRYDPVSDSWSPVSTVGAPSARDYPAAAWTGSQMLTWGGRVGAQYTRQGFAYDPVLDTWTSLPIAGSPSEREGASAVWSGTHLLIWGGFFTDGVAVMTVHDDGGRYNPLTQQWSPMSDVLPPPGKERHKAVMTDHGMFVYGGSGAGPPYGGLYDHELDAWVDVTLMGQGWHTFSPSVVSTGDEVVVWGGQDAGGTTGGERYDLATNSWSPMTTDDQPYPWRDHHSSVWTGDFMIVWGGDNNEPGGRYAVGNPDADADHVADICDACPADPDNDIDLDSVCGDVDNCAALYNPSQIDNDGDAHGDECDNCPQAANVTQDDADADGAGDVCDCAPADPLVRAPGVVNIVTVDQPAPGTIELAWNEVAGADRYQVTRGLVSTLSGTDFGSCLAPGVAGLDHADPEMPPPGDGFAYLVHGKSVACGLGSLGFGVNGLRINQNPLACF